MAVNLKTVLKASLLITAIGVALAISAIILKLVATLVTGSEAATVSLISTTYSFFLWPVFFILYLWAGMRATRKFRLDAVGAGATSAVSFMLISFTRLLLEIVLSLLFVSRVLGGTSYISDESVIAANIFGETATKGMGILLAALCGVGVILVGGLVNFVIGGLGSIIVQRRR